MCRKGRECVFSEGRLVFYELRVKEDGPSIVPDGRWGPTALLTRYAEELGPLKPAPAHSG